MNYRRIYMLIISRAKSEVAKNLRPSTKAQKRNFPGQYFEFHHILPKSLFPNWITRNSNIVPLTAREHFFCHQLLTKIYPCKQMYFALRAFKHNPNADYNLTSIDYEMLKRNNEKLKKVYYESEEFRVKRRLIRKNMNTEEYREKCRQAALKSRTPEVKKKISEGVKKARELESPEHKIARYKKVSETRKSADTSLWKKRTNYTKLSAETKEKIREKVKAHHADPAYRQHISDTWKAWREKGNASHKRSSRCVETGEVFVTVKALREQFGRGAVQALYGYKEDFKGLHFKFI